MKSVLLVLLFAVPVLAQEGTWVKQCVNGRCQMVWQPSAYVSPPGFHRHMASDGTVIEHADSNAGKVAPHLVELVYKKYNGPVAPTAFATDGPPVSEAYLTTHQKMPQTAEPPLAAVPMSETFYAARFPRAMAFVAKQPVRTLAKRLLRPLFFFRCR